MPSIVSEVLPNSTSAWSVGELANAPVKVNVADLLAELNDTPPDAIV